MKHYIEMTLLPSADIELHFLWEKVYQQLHFALVESGKGEVAVSFPDYDYKRRYLGAKVRLLSSSKAVLESIRVEQWFSRLLDYVHIARIRPVPDVAEHRVFRRVQTKSSIERLARRYAKRNQLTEAEAQHFFKDKKEVCSSAPFIRMKSQSSGNCYRLMIASEASKQAQEEGQFSSYGLSSERTVPHF